VTKAKHIQFNGSLRALCYVTVTWLAIREALDHSPPFSAEVNYAWSCISTHPYVFMACYLVKHRNNFLTLPLPGSLALAWRPATLFPSSALSREMLRMFPKIDHDPLLPFPLNIYPSQLPYITVKVKRCR